MVFLMLQIIASNWLTILLLILLLVFTWELYVEPRMKEFFKKYLIDPIINPLVKTFGKLSDERMKEKIIYIGKTNQGLNVYEFNYIYDENKTRYIGLIAQDLKGTEFEKFIDVDETGLYKINYHLLEAEFNNKLLPYKSI